MSASSNILLYSRLNGKPAELFEHCYAKLCRKYGAHAFQPAFLSLEGEPCAGIPIVSISASAAARVSFAVKAVVNAMNPPVYTTDAHHPGEPKIEMMGRYVVLKVHAPLISVMRNQLSDLLDCALSSTNTAANMLKGVTTEDSGITTVASDEGLLSGSAAECEHILLCEYVGDDADEMLAWARLNLFIPYITSIITTLSITTTPNTTLLACSPRLSLPETAGAAPAALAGTEYSICRHAGLSDAQMHLILSRDIIITFPGTTAMANAYNTDSRAASSAGKEGGKAVQRWESVSAIRCYRLYVGGADAAASHTTFSHNIINNCVNCATADGVESQFRHLGVQYREVYSLDSGISRVSAAEVARRDPGKDWPDVSLLSSSALSSGEGLLVHCLLGVNRSVTTAALLLVMQGMAPSLGDAIELIRSKRRIANPMEQYKKFAADFLAAQATIAPAEDPAVDACCTGACGIVTHNYIKHGGLYELTVFLVRDHSRKFTAPFESRDMAGRGKLETQYNCGRRALLEELLLQEEEVPAEDMEDRTRFRKFTVYQNPARHMGNDAVFITSTPMPALAGYSRSAFLRRRARLERDGAPGCYLETTELAHVPVRELLAPVVEGRTTTVYDVDGRSIKLRGIFAAVIADEAVKSELRRQLRRFEEEKAHFNDVVSKVA